MPCHDRVVGPRDVDAVVDDVAGVGDPLAAAHELVFDRLAERVAHAAVIAGEADAAAHGPGEVRHLVLLDLRHRVDRHDQAQVVDARGRRRPRRGLQAHLEALFPSMSATIAAPCSGSWPLQPPQTMSASRICFFFFFLRSEFGGAQAAEAA